MSWEKPKRHEPLLEFNGRLITGLKRCKNCGLSETYWERWPDCESCRGVKIEKENSMGTSEPEQKQQFPTMLGPKPKPFNCAVCHKEHIHGGWEDTEVYFSSEMQIHMGCLQDHYRELLLGTKLAYENLKSALEIPQKAKHNPRKILIDALNALKAALHE